MSFNLFKKTTLATLVSGLAAMNAQASLSLSLDTITNPKIDCDTKIELLMANAANGESDSLLPAESMLDVLNTHCYQEQKTTNETDRTPPEIRSILLTTNSVNVNDGEKTVDITLRFYDESGVKGARVYLSPPTGFSWGSNKSAVASNWQKTDEPGVYESKVSFTFTDADVNGKWFLTLSHLVDVNNAVRFWLRENEIQAAGFNPYIVVTNDKVTEGINPEIKSITISDTEVDVNTGDKTVNIAIEAYDHSTMSKGVIRVSPPSQYKSLAIKYAESSDWQETDVEGVYRSNYSFTFTDKALPGEWFVASAMLTDSNGNIGAYNRGHFNQLGLPSVVTVKNQTELDIAPPSIDNVAFSSNQLTSTNGDQDVTLTVTMSDVSGMTKGYYALRAPEGAEAKDKLFTIEQWQQGNDQDEFVGTTSVSFSNDDLQKGKGVWQLDANIQIDSAGIYSQGAYARELTTLGATPYIFVDEAQISEVSVKNITGAKQLKAGTSTLVTLEITENTLSSLPRLFDLYLDSEAALKFDFHSIDQEYMVSCEDLNNRRSCRFSNGPDVESVQVSFKVAPSEAGEFAPTIRFSSVAPELDYSNNKATFQVTSFDLKQFNVVFKNWDGSVLSTQTIEENSAATAPQVPPREGYTFTGWNNDFNDVNQNLTITAQFEINKYQVKFVDWDDTVIKAAEVVHGQAATPPAEPQRNGYAFTGWDIAFDKVTSELVVKAQYKANTTPTTTDKEDKGSSGGAFGFLLAMLSTLLAFGRRRISA
ncbi:MULTISPECIES: InlB B-repeat-containing protein [Pseudoalteromonas]|uniref:InlB B-repeat-containing protein n=1 Tax=Pseudoalteromonas TaxID=53246 RepID=UPI000FFEBCC4|nr:MULTISPECIES: InlB B-repeat-containing protein [Pseudoalteromonas]MCG9760208.1 InlB B-repeat-containing protein [Pseudoalteromonas sp. Isolate6]NKC21358.1 cell wall-binding protein [Pseudoalteromonas galatheae]RXE85887.1 cell wall-binding protein [Pseudoalteromonas sp. A757]